MAERKNRLNPIILVSSCKRDRENGCHEAQRNTSFSDSRISYRFVLGIGNSNPDSDEIVLDVPDDYAGLPWKTREGHRWALNNGFDYIFQCFADTYCNTERLLASGFEKRDYTGSFVSLDYLPHDVPQFGATRPDQYASGGPGYWLSPRCSRLIVEAEVKHPEEDSWMNRVIAAGAEDLWVGNVVSRAGIQGTHDNRYWSDGGQMLASNDVIAMHIGKGPGKYSPEVFYEQHRIFKESQ
ncbi:Uncharacterised protein [uncultured archaeon]|nr:Uncharacterised protein [uncultured archaeon]